MVYIISAMEPKSSFDASSINIKMLKFIKFQIAKPLSHLFTLSITSGVFPAKLKVSKIIPIFKGGTIPVVITIDLYRYLVQFLKY